MSKTTIKQLHRETAKYLNNNIVISAWVRTVRSSKDFGFMELNDGTFFKGVQVVFDNNLSNFSEAEKISIGSSVEVEGILVESPAAGQSFELKATRVTIINQAAGDYPLQKKKHSFEFLRTIAHLRTRSNTFSAVFRIRSAVSFAIHQFFNQQGFCYVHTPLITGSDCEGAGEVFTVTGFDLKKNNGAVNFADDFFGKWTGLTVSGQLEAEALALGLNKVYTFGPAFRAENSNTKVHLAELWMIEPEVAFLDLDGDMDLIEQMIKYVVKYVLDNYPEEMAFFNKLIDPTVMERLSAVLDNDFIRITYTEAIAILEKHNPEFEFKVAWGSDLAKEHERFLVDTEFKKPVFVTDYPKEIKPFYAKMINSDDKTVRAVDLLVPGIGEIISGAERESDLTKILARIKDMGLNPDDYEWYLDLRRYGCASAGFGIGLERFIMYLTGMENIRDVIPFPRTPKNANF